MRKAISNIKKLIIKNSSSPSLKWYHFDIKGSWIYCLNPILPDVAQIRFNREIAEDIINFQPNSLFKLKFENIDIRYRNTIYLILLYGDEDTEYKHPSNNSDIRRVAHYVEAGTQFTVSFGFDLIYTESFGDIYIKAPDNNIFTYHNVPAATYLHLPQGGIEVRAETTANIFIYPYNVG
ncbi:MAG: hypothetical protein ACTSVV_14410 [Promethearchaeota archaeon]